MSAVRSVGNIVKFGTGRQPRTPSALEETLWLHLRADKIDLPVREFRFHPTRMWRFDFAWPPAKLAVECEGGIWTQGRHTRGSGAIGDMDKYNAAVLLGWRVLRFTSAQVNAGKALKTIREALA